MGSKRKYLESEEQAIKDAKNAYREALAVLQAACEHKVVLKHEDDRYTTYRVCEDCGVVCIADWDSPSRARGHKALMSKRTYQVGWTEFAENTPQETAKGSGAWGT